MTQIFSVLPAHLTSESPSLLSALAKPPLNHEEEEAACLPGSPGSGCSLLPIRASRREVPNCTKLLRGLCFSPPLLPAEGDPPGCAARTARRCRSLRQRRQPRPSPRPSSCQRSLEAPRQPISPRDPLRPRSLLANWWSRAAPVGSSKRQENRESRPLVYHTCPSRAGGVLRPAPFLQPAFHWLRGMPHPRCDWRTGWPRSFK